MLDLTGLREQPFTLLPNPRFMYLSQLYQETKAKLIYFLKDRTASLYLYGPVGSGKTSLLCLIAQEVDGDPETNAAYAIAPNLKTSNQLLRLICEHFQVKTERSYGGSLQNMERFLTQQAREGRFPLLLIDEAQNLNRDELRLIHYLLNYLQRARAADDRHGRAAGIGGKEHPFPLAALAAGLLLGHGNDARGDGADDPLPLDDGSGQHRGLETEKHARKKHQQDIEIGELGCLKGGHRARDGSGKARRQDGGCRIQRPLSEGKTGRGTQ
jgi:hypothetical protein